MTHSPSSYCRLKLRSSKVVVAEVRIGRIDLLSYYTLWIPYLDLVVLFTECVGENAEEATTIEAERSISVKRTLGSGSPVQ